MLKHVLFCLVLISPLTAWGDERLDNLFAKLQMATDEISALEIEEQVWIAWTTPDDPALAEQMKQVLRARREANFTKALSLLDEIVARWSDYAEGWNQRATVHFMLVRTEASLADIDETLKREPRHFGALSGRAMIYVQQGQTALAVQNILAAMTHHPYVRERHLLPGLLGQQAEPN